MSKIREKESLECGRMHIWALKTQKLHIACFTHTTPLCYVGNFRPQKLGPPWTNPGSAPALFPFQTSMNSLTVFCTFHLVSVPVLCSVTEPWAMCIVTSIVPFHSQFASKSQWPFWTILVIKFCVGKMKHWKGSLLETEHWQLHLGYRKDQLVVTCFVNSSILFSICIVVFAAASSISPLVLSKTSWWFNIVLVISSPSSRNFRNLSLSFEAWKKIHDQDP